MSSPTPSEVAPDPKTHPFPSFREAVGFHESIQTSTPQANITNPFTFGRNLAHTPISKLPRARPIDEEYDDQEEIDENQDPDSEDDEFHDSEQDHSQDENNDPEEPTPPTSPIHTPTVAVLHNTVMSKFEIATFNRIIPEYKGDTDSLNIFLRRCDTYHKTLTNKGKQNFIDHLIFKLSGRAFVIYESKPVTDWKTLRQDFSNGIADKKSVASLQNELLSLRQRPTQNATEFAEVVRNKLKKLNDKIAESYENNDEVKTVFFLEHEKLAVRAFKEGLNPPLKYRVLNSTETSFEKIRQFALEEEPFTLKQNMSSTTNHTTSREKSKTYDKTQTPQPNNGNYPQKQFNNSSMQNSNNRNEQPRQQNNFNRNRQFTKPTITCERCNKIGHSRETCYVRLPTKDNQSSHPNQSNNNPIPNDHQNQFKNNFMNNNNRHNTPINHITSTRATPKNIIKDEEFGRPVQSNQFNH